MFEVSRCPACGGSLAPRFETDVGDRKMSVSVCRGCGSYVKNPFFDEAELREIYAHYRHHERHFDPGAGEIDNLVAKVRRIERFAPGRGRLLEVGCGRGYLLAQALRRGWDVRGLELEGSAEANLLPEVRGKVRFIPSEEGFGEIEPGAYDVVCSYQVFEHLRRPARAMEAWARGVRPGALLVLDTPNAGGWGARRHGGRWAHNTAAEHFVLFTRAALEGLFRANGLRVLHRLYGGAPSLSPASPSAPAPARRVFRSRALTRLLRSLVHRLGLGDNIELIGRREA